MTEYNGYRILPLDNMIGYFIQHIGRGSVADSLQGAFTSIKVAKSFIDYHVKGKEESDGETVPSSGSEQVQRRPYHRRESSNKR